MDYWIGLGSNLGDSVSRVERALDYLDSLRGVAVVRRSGLYRTPPWGDRAQPMFVNAVAELAAAFPPLDMLETLLEAERHLGRARNSRRWGPREIDLDLLLAGDLIIHRPGLTVPHPRMHRRAFVLVPLAELEPELVIPARGRVSRLLQGLDRDGIERLA